MTIEQIGSLGEMIGAIGVILSLLYVGKQLAQNNRNQRIAAIQSHNQAYMQNAGVLAKHAETWSIGMQNFSTLELHKKIEFGFLLMTIFRQAEQAYFLHKEEVLPAEVFNKAMVIIASALYYQGIKAWWEKRKDYFDDGFIDKLESINQNVAFNPLYENY